MIAIPPLRRPLSLACAFVALVISLPTHAAELLKAGDAVPALQARDQHDQAFTLADDTRWLLVAFDMGTGKAANVFLQKKGASFLPEHHAVFIANIHGMPGVGRVFALPKMRRYPHRIILADEEHLLDPFPREDDRVTLIKLGPGRVVESITYWNPRDAELPLE